MTQAEWKTFLYELSRVALAEDEQQDPICRIFSPEVHASGYLGYEGATKELLTAAESRLGATLPPSYRTFLQVSNGWPMISTTIMPGRLWSVQEIYWIRDYDPYDIKPWVEGCLPEEDTSPEEHLYRRDMEQGSGAYRQAYVKNLLSISDRGDACNLLLSPEVVDDQGEWECWHIANWHPGAEREHSFEAWMIDQYKFLRTVLPS